MKTRKVIIGFSSSRLKFPLFSWLIRFWESFYHSIKQKKLTVVEQSHCYLKFDTTRIFDDYTVYHAAKSMIHYVPYDTFLKTNKVRKEVEVEISYDDYRKIRKKLHKNLTVNYGTFQNLGIFLVDIVELITGKDIKNPFKKGYNCSEAASEVIICLKPALKDYIRLNKIKPQDVRLLLEKHFEDSNG